MEVVEGIEESWDESNLQETDKAWDAIHRCLTDGTLSHEGGAHPLGACILGGRALYRGDDYVVSYKSPDEVRDVASALAQVSEEQLRAKYFQIDPDDYGAPPSEEDFAYTLGWFGPLKEFFLKAAQKNRPVIFTADQ